MRVANSHGTVPYFALSRPRPELCVDRLDKDVQQIIGPQAELVSGDAQDAGRASAEHLDSRSAADAEFLQAMNVVGTAEDAENGRRMTGGQILQRNGVGNHDVRF
jgi:hypothetical protein